MLILTRKDGEELVIGSGENAVRVVVHKINGNRVKLGIAAPKEMPIKRGELDKDDEA